MNLIVLKKTEHTKILLLAQKMRVKKKMISNRQTVRRQMQNSKGLMKCEENF